MWKNNFKKYFQKINTKRAVLLVMVIGILFFSFYSLLKINKMNYWVNRDCEKRTYVDWNKDEKMMLSAEKKNELEKLKEKILQCFSVYFPEYFSSQGYISIIKQQEMMKRCGLGETINPFEGIVYRHQISEIEEILKQGYEIKEVPDEERRAVSRQEVNNYQECLKNQKEAVKERPEAYKFLIIIDLIILVIGLIVLKFW
jgi:hypothetical protein